MVLLFNNTERASRAFTILQDATFDNKQLLVLLLPNIQVPVSTLVPATVAFLVPAVHPLSLSVLALCSMNLERLCNILGIFSVLLDQIFLHPTFSKHTLHN